MSSASFCRRPWTDLSVERDGTLSPCCLIPITDAGQQDFREKELGAYLKSAALRDLRTALERGERPAACQICWNNERLGNGSLRVNRPARDSVDRGEFTEVHIKTSSVCNFKCRICQPLNSSAWLAEQKAHGMALEELISTNPVFEVKYPLRDPGLRAALLDTVIPAARLIRISGGEPLLCSDTLALFRDLAARGLGQKHYRVITNLSALQFSGVDYLEFWRQFPNLKLIASCDGAGAAVEYSRTGFSWPVFLRNLELARAYVTDINCVLSVFSVYSIPALAHLCARLGINLNVEPEFHKSESVQILPDAEKRKIELLYQDLGVSELGARLPAEEEKRIREIVLRDLWAADLSGTDRPRVFKTKNAALDRRRGTDFRASFPQLAEWYESLGEEPAGTSRRSLTRAP
jgi:MoaA/NifB/PqqE/SkfB family radical SAM enzyme